MRLARILLLVCVGLATIGWPSAQPSLAQEPSAPYLYYESSMQHAVIVERADGTDAHVLGGVTMPADHRIGIGPQFSYDNQWVAWTSRGGSGGDAKLYVVRVDGTAQVQQVEGLNRVNELVWSPINNYLAIIRTTRAGNSNGAEQEYEIMLVDTQFGDTITRQVQSADFISETAWSADGETFSVYYAVDPDGDYSTPEAYKRLDMTLSDNFKRTDITPTECAQSTYVFPNTTVAVSEHQLWLADGTAIDLPAGYFQELQWSPDGQQVVVWMRDECTASQTEADYHVWYTRVGDAGFQEVIPNAVPRAFLDAPRWRSELSTPWSPDSQMVALAGRDGLAYVLNTSTMSLTSIPMPSDLDPSRALFQWIDNEALYVQANFSANGVYELKVGATEFTKVANTPEYPDVTNFSADGRYMAFSGTCPIVGELTYGVTCVVDRQEGTTAVIYPHSGTGTTGYNHEDIFWHPSSDWLFVVNGGGAGGGEQFIQVVNATGTVRRELTNCVYTECYGWLSAEINVATMPSIQTLPTIPVMTLTGMQDYVVKAEWNSQGTEIAVSSMDGNTYVFDAADGHSLYTVVGGIFDWSPDGTKLATVDRQLIENGEDYIITPNEGPIIIHDAVTGQTLSTIEGQYYNLDYSPDGQYLAAGSQLGDVAVIDVATGQMLYTTEFSNAVAVVAFSPDGQQLAIGGVGNEVWVWDYAGNTPAQVLPFTTELYFYGVFALEWRSDGTQLMGSGGPGMFLFGDTSVVFDFVTGDTIIVAETSYATFSLDGQYRAEIEDYNGELHVVELASHQSVFDLYRSGWWVDFKPDMTQVLAAEPYDVTVWQLP